MNNGRDCPHGRQVGKCDTCDLITAELELEKVTAERDALAAELADLCAFRDEVVVVMNESQGVWGWHKNHTIATWDELLPNVPDFQSPQHHLRQVRADAVTEFVEWAADTQPNIDCMLDDSTDYIANILAGKE